MVWTPGQNGGGKKSKGRSGDNYKSTQNIEFEKDWSFTLGATLGDRQKIKNILFQLQGFFPGRADSTILLEFECTMNAQNLMKIVAAIFEIMKV